MPRCPRRPVSPERSWLARVRGTFTASLTAVKDASGVAEAELWANGKYLGAGQSEKVATGKSSGNVKLVWKLTDKLGNTRSYTRIVIADNKAPSLSITKAPGNKAKVKVKGIVKVAVKAYDKLGNVTYTSTRIWYRK